MKYVSTACLLLPRLSLLPAVTFKTPSQHNLSILLARINNARDVSNFFPSEKLHPFHNIEQRCIFTRSFLVINFTIAIQWLWNQISICRSKVKIWSALLYQSIASKWFFWGVSKILCIRLWISIVNKKNGDKLCQSNFDEQSSDFDSFIVI